MQHLLTHTLRRALMLLILALVATLPAAADESPPAPARWEPSGYSLMAHIYTAHDRTTPWFQNKTPGLALRGDVSGWQGGVFCNSLSASKLTPEGSPYNDPKTRNCETTYYLANDLATDRSRWIGAHLMLGAAKGYHRGIKIRQGPLHADLMPLVAPGLRLGPIRVSVLGVHIYHLTIETRL